MKLFLKIFILIFSTIIISVLIYAFSFIRMEKKDLERELTTKIQTNEKLYSSSISALLYEFNKDVIEYVVDSIYQDKDVVKLELKDFSNNINIKLDTKKYDSKHIVENKINLIFNNEKIGILTITYSKKNILELLNHYKKNIFAFSIILLIILLSLLALITKKLTNSIEELSKATDTIANGDLEQKISVNSNDEVGELAKKFENMRISLNKRIKLTEKQSLKIQNLNEEMVNTQIKLIEILGEVIEKRYIDDPEHIKRVSQMSYLLAILYGCSQKDAQTLKMVSPMHDVGKIGIPDSILLKPEKLTPEEFEIMKTHSQIGYDFLKNTGKETLNMAADIAYEHHEKWDGTGYPRGIKGEEITIHGRITALADVFDALANKRCYKEAWEFDEIISYLLEQKGKQFEPKLIDIFIENIDKFIAIQKKYQD